MSTTSSETYRLETFADAVVAIAITLLVIEIRLAPHDEVLRIGGVGPDSDTSSTGWRPSAAQSHELTSTGPQNSISGQFGVYRG